MVEVSVGQKNPREINQSGASVTHVKDEFELWHYHGRTDPAFGDTFEGEVLVRVRMKVYVLVLLFVEQCFRLNDNYRTDLL